MSPGAALLLFVVLPIVLGVAVIAWVQRHAPAVTAGHRTSDLLRDGIPATGTLIDWRTPGQSFLDSRPMTTFRVTLHGDEPVELSITQSVPRGVLSSMKPGMEVDVRLSEDRSAGAVVLPRVAR